VIPDLTQVMLLSLCCRNVKRCYKWSSLSYFLRALYYNNLFVALQLRFLVEVPAVLRAKFQKVGLPQAYLQFLPAWL